MPTYKDLLIENMNYGQFRHIKEQEVNVKKVLTLVPRGLAPLKVNILDSEIKSIIKNYFPNSELFNVKDEEDFKILEYKNPTLRITINSENIVTSIFAKDIPIMYKGRDVNTYSFNEISRTIRYETDSEVKERVWQKDDWDNDDNINTSRAFIDAGILVEGNKDTNKIKGISVFKDEKDIFIE